jgi:hypothetical protein
MRERPLARREEMIARPARVRIRSRKPCFLWRRRLFGWKVRLLTRGSSAAVGCLQAWVFRCDVSHRGLRPVPRSGGPPVLALPVQDVPVRETKGDEMAGTRHLRRCDSTSERYGLPGHVVKRSRYLRRSFDDGSGLGERLLSTRATKLRRREARDVGIPEGVWGWPRIREAGEERVASLRGRALMSPWRADRRHYVRCGRVPFPLLPGRRVFASQWPILSPSVADGVPPTFAQGFDAHTQRVDNSVDNS